MEKEPRERELKITTNFISGTKSELISAERGEEDIRVTQLQLPRDTRTVVPSLLLTLFIKSEALTCVLFAGISTFFSNRLGTRSKNNLYSPRTQVSNIHPIFGSPPHFCYFESQYRFLLLLLSSAQYVVEGQGPLRSSEICPLKTPPCFRPKIAL